MHRSSYEESSRNSETDLFAVPRTSEFCPVRFRSGCGYQARLEQGARIVEVLKQSQNAPVPVEKQVAILYAVTKGILEKVKVEDVNAYEAGLYTYLDADAAGLEVMQLISTTGKLEPETEEKLRHVLEAYTENFLNTRPDK